MASEIGTAPSIAFSSRQTCLEWLNRTLESWLEAERDHLALWVPVALLAGISAWFLLPDSRGWAAGALGFAGVGGIAFVLARGGRAGHAIGWFGLIAAIGLALIWWRAESVSAPRLDRPAMVRLAGIVERIEPQPAQERIRLTIAVSTPGLPPRVRVNVEPDRMPADVAAGATVMLRARLMPPAPPAVPGAYDFARVAWFQGLGATGKAIGPVGVLAPPSDTSAWQHIEAASDRLSTHIQRSLPGVEGGVAAALATGDQGAIPEEDAEAMRRSGLAHLLSISGLHVTAMVAGTMFLVLRLLALSPWAALRWPLLAIAAGAGAVAGVAYTLLAGAEVPTVRSCIAALLVLAGLAMGRDAITLRLVAAGAIVVLLLWPEAAAGPSFQLSFAAVVAIVALHEHPRVRALLSARDEGWVRRIGRLLLGMLFTGIAVEIALSPIALFHFHRSGLYGAAANIVAIPLTTFVIMPLEALALLLDLAGLGAPAWWLAGKAIALLLAIAHGVADSPGAIASLPAMPRGAFALMLAGGLWLALWRTRVRRLGLLPFAAGALWAAVTPAPDLLVTGDGRHAAIRGTDGAVGLLRPRAGDYVRDMLAENVGLDGDPAALDAIGSARCGPDLCIADIERDGRTWRILATRSRDFVEIGAFVRACADADIVISDRRLPRTCRPRWIKADRPFLAQTGGLAVTFASGSVVTVRDAAGRHPWAD